MKTTSIDGSFRLEAVAPAYSLVSIADQDNNLLASAIVRNGDEISLKLDPAEPINSRASGNKPTEAFDAFIHDNAESIIKGMQPLSMPLLWNISSATGTAPECRAPHLGVSRGRK